MNINPKVEPWLRALLDGVENSNHGAEVVATAAYAAERLVKALEAAHSLIHDQFYDPKSAALYGEEIALEARDAWNKICAALALACGETP